MEIERSKGKIKLINNADNWWSEFLGEIQHKRHNIFLRKMEECWKDKYVGRFQSAWMV